jgi:hypothetical protein
MALEHHARDQATPVTPADPAASPEGTKSTASLRVVRKRE